MLETRIRTAGGGATLIGGGVIGGIANCVLFLDTNGNLSVDPLFTFDGSNLLTVQGITDQAATEILRLAGASRATPASNDNVYQTFFLDKSDGTSVEVGRLKYFWNNIFGPNSTFQIWTATSGISALTMSLTNTAQMTLAGQNPSIICDASNTATIQVDRGAASTYYSAQITFLNAGSTKWNIGLQSWGVSDSNNDLYIDDGSNKFFRFVDNGTTADFYVNLDNESIIFGAGADAKVYYDGANLNINPKAVGTGYLDILGQTNADNFVSDIAIGTQPYACTSTTLNTNLNADLWDGYQFADYLDQAVKTTSAPQFATGTVVGNLTLADGSITDSGGAISFGNENLTTTGTLAVGNAADVVNLTLNGKASQTASYLKVIDSGSNTLFEVDDEGRIGVRCAADSRYAFISDVTETLGDVAMTDFRFVHFITCNTNNSRAHVGMAFVQDYSGSANFTRTGGGGGSEGIVLTQRFNGTGTISEATGLQLSCFTSSSQVITEYKYMTLGGTSNDDTSSIGTVYGINILTMKASGVTTAYGIRSYDGIYLFNDSGTDYSDFIIEGDTDTALFYSDASADRVGIGESAPDYKLDVNGSFGCTPGRSVTPADNGDVVVEATTDESITLKLKGTDGTIRTVVLSLT